MYSHFQAQENIILLTQYGAYEIPNFYRQYHQTLPTGLFQNFNDVPIKLMKKYQIFTHSVNIMKIPNIYPQYRSYENFKTLTHSIELMKIPTPAFTYSVEPMKTSSFYPQTQYGAHETIKLLPTVQYEAHELPNL